MSIDKDKFIEIVDTLHAQNLSGREDFRDAFKSGISAAFDEFEKLKVCDHPFAFVMSKCNGEINKCLKCGKVF